RRTLAEVRFKAGTGAELEGAGAEAGWRQDPHLGRRIGRLFFERRGAPLEGRDREVQQTRVRRRDHDRARQTARLRRLDALANARRHGKTLEVISRDPTGSARVSHADTARTGPSGAGHE